MNNERINKTGDRVKAIQESELLLLSNEILSSSVRFTVMLILFIHRKVHLNELQKLLRLTSGKLDHHVRRLEEASYIVKKKIFYLNRAITSLSITDKGRVAFNEYTSNMRHILEKIK
jgi:DNA-binding MarR family transcriptional regulator